MYMYICFSCNMSTHACMCACECLPLPLSLFLPQRACRTYRFCSKVGRFCGVCSFGFDLNGNSYERAVSQPAREI